jgi:hypothetical protein
MLADREGEIARLSATTETPGVELERLRAEAERRQNAVGKIIAAAGELS